MVFFALMKKTAIAVAAVLILAGLAVWWAVPHPSSAAERTCGEFLDKDLLFIRALKDASGNACNSLTDETDRATCIAWTSHNPGACPEKNRASCAPIAANKPEECINGDVLCTALASQDASACNRFANEGEREECIAWVSLDDSLLKQETDCKKLSHIKECITQSKDPDEADKCS